MTLEPMTLIERLRNPAWESDGFMMEGKPARLKVAQTVSDMETAAREIERLQHELIDAHSYADLRASGGIVGAP